jgi:hypothetical protein
MNKTIFKHAAGLFLAAAGLCSIAGCETNFQHRTSFNKENPGLPGPDPLHSVIEFTNGCKLGFVEFDDEGWFVDTDQKHAVTTMITNELASGTAAQKGAIIVFFVHGWKNNADYADTNVQTFRIVLKQLADVENALSTNQGRAAREIIGVYAGWRGLSIKSDYFPPLGKETTFWSRKRAAEKVGGYGALTELLMDVESIQRDSDASLPTNAPRTKLIIVGHSFGADAVYNATAQIITGRFVESIKPDADSLLKPLGDQVILLNPAFEAARFYNLAQLAHYVKGYSPEQRPVLSVFQSEGDWATHTFFPIGQELGTTFQRHRTDREKEADHHSVGWFDPIITHQLKYDPIPATPDADNTNNAPTPKLDLRAPSKLPQVADNIALQRQLWRSDSPTNRFGSCVMTSTPRFRAREPIVVVSVDKNIMKDHDDIGNPVLINFLQEYIPFCDDEAEAPASGH